MAAPYNRVSAKAEQAVRLWIVSQNVGISSDQIVVGRSSAGKSYNQLVVVYAEKSKERPTGSGNSDVKIKVLVKTTKGDSTETDTSHETLCGKVFDALSAYDPTNPNYFAEQLSALVEDFTVFGNGQDIPSETESGIPEAEADAWQDVETLLLYCAPSDIS